MPRVRGAFARLAAVAAVTVSAVVVVTVTTGEPVGAAVPAGDAITDRVIITFDRPGRRLAAADRAAVGVASVRGFGARGEIVRLPSRLEGAALDAALQRIVRRPGVVRVEADALMQIVTSDTEYARQWDLVPPSSGVFGIDVEGAWATTTGSSSVRVAVIDTGYVEHADLAGRIVGGYDFISDSRIGNDGNGRDGDARDTGDWITSSEARRGFFRGCQTGSSSWHGTHVAGTIGAATDNGTGIAGINQVSQIVPVRVLGKCGGYTSDIVDGMRWAAGLTVAGVPTNPYPAQVLSLSLGGGGACTATYQNAIDEITAAGAVVVVAAGNSNADAAAYSPASCAGVVTVASTGKAGNRAHYSNYGSTVELAAPGGDRTADGFTILSTLNSGTTSPVAGGDVYVDYQGTSMATPHVTGVVSLMLSVAPGLTPSQVTSLLRSSATPFPVGSTCIGSCGAGILNAAAAVAAAAGSGPSTTTSTTTTTVLPTTTTSTTTTSTTTTTTVLPTTTTTEPPSAAPGTFGKLSPADNARNLRGRVTLTWSASTGATEYQVCVDATPNGSCDGVWSTIAGTAAQTSSLARRTTYEWQVRAANGAGTTDADGGRWYTFTSR
jgi:serine protease